MRNILFIFSVSTALFSSCSSNENIKTTNTKTSELKGDWELTKELVNNQSLDYTQNPIKTILSFKENGYFLHFDDLAKSGLSGAIDKIQLHYRGQYTLEENVLTLNHSVNKEENNEIYDIKNNKKKSLVLINTDSEKELHYTKR